jgi:hypothetical protein
VSSSLFSIEGLRLRLNQKVPDITADQLYFRKLNADGVPLLAQYCRSCGSTVVYVLTR